MSEGEYPKIETLFDRGENFKVIEDAFRLPEFEIDYRSKRANRKASEGQ